MTAPKRVGTPLPTHEEVSAASNAHGPLVRVTAVCVVEGWQIVVEVDNQITKAALITERWSSRSAATYVADQINVKLRELMK